MGFLIYNCFINLTLSPMMLEFVTFHHFTLQPSQLKKVWEMQTRNSFELWKWSGEEEDERGGGACRVCLAGLKESSFTGGYVATLQVSSVYSWKQSWVREYASVCERRSERFLTLKETLSYVPLMKGERVPYAKRVKVLCPYSY